MRSLNDPIVKILTKNSRLTKTQLETFLIDALAENLAEKSLRYEEKAKLRLLRTGVSRGAFNRTLKQARRNIIQSNVRNEHLRIVSMIRKELEDSLERLSKPRSLSKM